MKNLLYFLVILVSIKSYGQGFSDEKVSLTNFIKRMYTAKPFEGVKIVDDYDHQYLISVISLEKVKYTSESIMNRVAQVKAQSQASTFLNGATISNVVYPSLDPSIFEVKYPNTDIQGRVVNL